MDKILLELWFQASLFADFVRSDSIKKSVPFNWNSLYVICIYGMILPFAQQIKSTLFQISDQITSFNRHVSRFRQGSVL